MRAARAEDADATLAIVREAAEEARGIITRPEEIRSLAEQQVKLAEASLATEIFLVAEADGRVVGILGLHRGARAANRHTAEIGLTVAASHRGRGIGRLLMVAAETWARRMGVAKLRLGVFSDNLAARRLYERLGYVEEGILRGQYLVAGAAKDEVLMAKWLT